jgi:hypothetical protein
MESPASVTDRISGFSKNEYLPCPAGSSTCLLARTF